MIARLLAVALLLAPSLARAEDDSPEKQQARMLLSQGNALFEKGDLRAALADFRAAYALYPSPKLLVNAAAAERELGDLPGAATDLRHFLDDATEDESALVDKARSDLRSLERRVGRIALSGWPARSTLEIDGRPARDPTYVRPGAHSVKAKSPSGVELEHDVDVAAGQGVELPLPEGAELTTPTPPPAPPPPTVKKKRTPGWVVPVAVLGALLVVGGITAGVLVATEATPKPLGGDLGTIPFSGFK